MSPRLLRARRSTIILMAGGVSESSTNFSFMRLLKTWKMMRTWRTIRVLRMLRELRLMLSSVFGGIRSMLWALLMVALVTYMFSCCFTQAMAIHLSDIPEEDENKKKAILRSWGSVLLSMDTLFMCSTGGDDWKVPSTHLREFSGMIYALFLIYISFFLFVVTNTLTSIIMEGTMTRATTEKSDIIASRLKQKYEHIKLFKELYSRIDADNSGDLSMDEMHRHMQDQRAVAFFQSLDIDVSDVEQFFGTLSQDGTTSVDLETFVIGCMKLKGTARSMDLQCLYSSYVCFARSTKHFQEGLALELASLQGAMAKILRHLDPPPHDSSLVLEGSAAKATI